MDSRAIEETESAIPRCFLSYSWDSNAHKDWVRRLAQDLRASGVDVILDQWHLHPGADAPVFMETSVRDAEYVIVVCTPRFRDKTNRRAGGVGWEASVVTGEMLVLNKDTKVLPILREGGPDNALPSYLMSRVYIDFRSDADYREGLDGLLRAIFRAPRHVAPPLGKPPRFSP